MGRLDISTLGNRQNGKGAKLLKSVGSWMGTQAKRGKSSKDTDNI
jgi:hypothetical protein